MSELIHEEVDWSSVAESLAKEMYSIPFTSILGLELTQLDSHTAKAKFPMQKSLVGNAYQQILHGGVIATAFDTVAGAIAIYKAIEKLQHLPKVERYERLGKLCTVDMRTDFIKPGAGDYFTVTATPISTGSKIIRAQAELHNDSNQLIATGNFTFAY